MPAGRSAPWLLLAGGLAAAAGASGVLLPNATEVAGVLLLQHPSADPLVLLPLADGRLLHVGSGRCLATSPALACRPLAAMGGPVGAAAVLADCPRAPPWDLLPMGNTSIVRLVTAGRTLVPGVLPKTPSDAAEPHTPAAAVAWHPPDPPVPPSAGRRWWPFRRRRPHPEDRAPPATPALVGACPSGYSLAPAASPNCSAACGCVPRDRRAFPTCAFCCRAETDATVDAARCLREVPFSCPPAFVPFGPGFPGACRRTCPPGTCCRRLPSGECHATPHVRHTVRLVAGMPSYVVQGSNHTVEWASAWLEGPITLSAADDPALAPDPGRPSHPFREGLPPSGSAVLTVPADLTPGPHYLRVEGAAYPHRPVIASLADAPFTVLPPLPVLCAVADDSAATHHSGGWRRRRPSPAAQHKEAVLIYLIHTISFVFDECAKNESRSSP